MDTITIALVLTGFFIAAFLKGITGLGFSTICLGILASFIDIKIAIPLLIIPSLSSNLLVMLNAGGFFAALRRFWPVYLAAIPGLLIGLWLLAWIASPTARMYLGVVLFLYGAWALFNSELSLSRYFEKWLAAPVGFITGIVNGMTGSQVMPVLPFMLALKLSKDMLVQAINISFTLSSLVMLPGLAGLGLMDWEKLYISLIGIIPVAAGIRMGSKIRTSLPESAFRRIILSLLIILGLTLIFRQ